MSLMSTILKEMSSLTTPQRTFLREHLSALSCFAGRANRTNLHRYGASSPRTQYRWVHRQDRALDWPDFQARLLHHLGRWDELYALIIDATFVPKSGKHTFGLASFWDGSQERAHRGLELSVLALLEQDGQTAWALDASQTPPTTTKSTSRMAYYLEHLRRHRQRLPDHVRYVLADSLYANRDFVLGLQGMGLHLVSKLRKDANLRYLYEGSYAGRGRPRKYDGKVDFKDWSRWQKIEEIKRGYEGYTQVVNHEGFGTNLRVVVLWVVGHPERRRVLMSTDVEMPASEVIRLYGARYQIEFIFRDGKQYTGLADGQMRDQAGLAFHCNASLAALNLMRAEHLEQHGNVISIASVKRRNYNEKLLLQLFSQLGLDPTSHLYTPAIARLRNFGAIAA